MAILLCGGAGYIGSHVAHVLLQRGMEIVVVDNLQTGHRQALPQSSNLTFVKGDIRDPSVLDAIFSKHFIEAVLHFAASSLVGESMLHPLNYFNNNVGGMQVLLESMLNHSVYALVFSSTAAVYGTPEYFPIDEDSPTLPTSPYGESKLIMEKMIKWVTKAHGLNSVCLRYFNVAGALPDGSIGEAHNPESHLIPIVLRVPLGLHPQISIFGNDWPTEDGTCIRDYIGIMDLVDAHLKALDYAMAGKSGTFNLGSCQGFSVLEVIRMAEKVTGQNIPIRNVARRAGDPPHLVASCQKAKEILGWQPKQDLEEIISSAWNWHKQHPNGFV